MTAAADHAAAAVSGASAPRQAAGPLSGDEIAALGAPRRRATGLVWTPEHDAALSRHMAAGGRAKDFAIIWGISPMSVSKRLASLGALTGPRSRHGSRTWLVWELNALRAHLAQGVDGPEAWAALAARLCRTEYAVRHMAQNLRRNCAPVGRSEDAAEAPSDYSSPMAEARAARRRRACLCCGAAFMSWGSGNRLCPSCGGGGHVFGRHTI